MITFGTLGNPAVALALADEDTGSPKANELLPLERRSCKNYFVQEIISASRVTIRD
jgi:hypothetical protein